MTKPRLHKKLIKQVNEKRENENLPKLVIIRLAKDASGWVLECLEEKGQSFTVEATSFSKQYGFNDWVKTMVF